MNCTHRNIQSWDTTDGEPVDFWSCTDCGHRFEPLQPAAQPIPLRDEQIKGLWMKYAPAIGGPLYFARAIEAAHGIKEAP